MEAEFKARCKQALERKGWHVHRVEPGRGADLGYPDLLVHTPWAIWPVEVKWGRAKKHLGLNAAQRVCHAKIVAAGQPTFVVRGAAGADWDAEVVIVGGHERPAGARLAAGVRGFQVVSLGDLGAALKGLAEGCGNELDYGPHTYVAPLNLREAGA